MRGRSRLHVAVVTAATLAIAAGLLHGYAPAAVAGHAPLRGAPARGPGGAPGPPAPAPGGAPGPPAPAPEPPLRYRPSGCRVSGPVVAYDHGPSRRRWVALAFDDGPWTLTSRFVTMLHDEHAVATFFMIGRQITRGDSRLLRRELRDGDALGDHTWSHPYLTSTLNVRGQLNSVVNVIRANTGYTPCVFRPPYGAYDPAIVRAARSLGLATVLWDVDPRDWSLPGVGAIVQRVVAGVKPGAIVISHDGGGNRTETLAAYPHIIAALRARGYRFVTVPQLLGFRPVYTRCRRLCYENAVEHVPRGAVVRSG